MNRITIDGKGYDIPSGIEEVTIKKFLELRRITHDHQSLIEWATPELDLSSLSTNNYQVERELTNAFALVNALLKEVYTFMESPSRIEAPKQITILGLTVELIPGLLTSLPYWPYVQVKNIIQQEAKKEVFDPTDRIPEVLAHYLYATVTKSKYNEEKAEEFIEVINELPMVEAIQVGNFFFLKFRNIYLSRMSRFFTSLNLQKLKLKLKFSRVTAILTPWKRSRAETY